MNPPQTVTITAACPHCGTDATWTGTRTDPGGATAYDIDCVRCDRPWSLTEQLARRPIPTRPAPAPLPAVIPRNLLLRMLQRALDRRAA